MFKRWCRLMDREAWIADPRFADDELRARNIDPLNARMIEWCEGKSMEEAMAALGEVRVPASPVLSPQQAIDDPHLRHMGWLKPLDYPGLSTPAPVIETPFRMSRTPPVIATRAPTIGEHSDTLLGELGYDADAVAGFRERCIV